MKDEKVEVRKLCLIQAVTVKLHINKEDDLTNKSVVEIAKEFTSFINTED